MLLKLLCILLLYFASWAQAADLAWNASVVDEEHAAPDGYRIHWGAEPGVYTGQADAGLALTWHIPDDWFGQFYFVASAYNAAGQSGYSNEVIFTREPQQHIGATGLTASRYQLEALPMSFSLLQSRATIAYSRTSQTLAFSSNVTAGSLLIACYSHWNTARTVTFTDTLGNDYTEITIQNGEAQATLGYAITTSGGANTVTATISGGSADLCLDIAEFSATAAISFESSTTGTGSGTTASSGALTPAGDALYIGLLGTYNMSAITEAAGWTLINEQSGYDPSISLIYRTGNGSQTASWTITSREWTAIIAAFKEASGGGSSAVPIFGSEISSKVLFGGIVR